MTTNCFISMWQHKQTVFTFSYRKYDNYLRLPQLCARWVSYFEFFSHSLPLPTFQPTPLKELRYLRKRFDQFFFPLPPTPSCSRNPLKFFRFFSFFLFWKKWDSGRCARKRCTTEFVQGQLLGQAIIRYLSRTKCLLPMSKWLPIAKKMLLVRQIWHILSQK